MRFSLYMLLQMTVFHDGTESRCAGKDAEKEQVNKIQYYWWDCKLVQPCALIKY